MLNTLGAGLYLVVASLCVWATLAAHRLPVGNMGARARWLAIAGLFIVLAASRLTNFEEGLRSALRMWLVAEGQYGHRRDLQGPLAAALIAAAGVAGLVLMLQGGGARRDRRTRALVWAGRAAAAMIALVALRLVSFHQTDALLHGARLNWVIDPGLAVMVGLCAWVYTRPADRRRGARA